MTCAHKFGKSGYYQYLRCEDCGTFKSTVAPPPETLYTADYWTHERGHSTLKEQAWNCGVHLESGKSKYQFVLDHIETEDRSAALEIGCAPGNLLLMLKGIGGFEKVVGIEADIAFEKEIREIGAFGGLLVFGFFPSVTIGCAGEDFSLIIALDVFEHSHEPEAFLSEAARLLKQGGQLFLMLPLVGPDLEERFYNPTEHVYLHSKGNLSLMLLGAGFGDFKFDRWCNGHDLISARKL